MKLPISKDNTSSEKRVIDGYCAESEQDSDGVSTKMTLTVYSKYKN